MPSWIGPWEIAIVLVLALLIFGPKKLPDLGASLGRSISGFKRGLKESQEEIKAAVKEDMAVDKEAALNPPETASSGAAPSPAPSVKAEVSGTAGATQTGSTEQS